MIAVQAPSPDGSRPNGAGPRPGVMVGAGRGWWQAVIPQPNGEQVITRHTLGQLLNGDKLDELAGERGP